MLAIVALVLFLAAAVVAGVFKSWPVVLLAAGLAAWLWEPGAGLIP